MDKGNKVFKVGDRFRFKIVNNTNRILFYTILDIQPDNKVNVLFPAKGDLPENCNIRPDQSPLTPQKSFGIYPPYGADVIKIIASDKPLDLAGAFASRGATQ